MAPAIDIASLAISRASRVVCRASALAAASAYAPPDPIAMIPSSGSMRSPLPESRYVDLRVHHDQHRFQTPQDAVGPPVLGQLHDRPLEVAAVLFELGFEAREQRERVGRRAGKAGENPVVVELPDLPGRLLDDGVAERDLAIARHHRPGAVANRQDRRCLKHQKADRIKGRRAGPRRPERPVWRTGLCPIRDNSVAESLYNETIPARIRR